MTQLELLASSTSAEKLTRIWQDVLSVDFIGIDQDFFDLGGDSSLAVQIFARIEQVFGVRLPLVTLYEASTIEGLDRILNAELPGGGWSPLVAIQTSGSRAPLFCFHGAGGNVLIYRKLAQHLGPDQPFYGLQSQGVDGISPALNTIGEMAALYLRHIRRVQPHGPYFLCGYCMGGTVAYEAAQQLSAAGESIALLALLDTMNWHKLPLTRWVRLSHACQRIAFPAAEFFNLDSNDQVMFFREKWEALRDRLPVWFGALRSTFDRRRSGPTSSAFVLLARLWQTNDQACWKYIPQPYPGTLTDVRPSRQYRVFDKPDLKWNHLVHAEKIVVVPVYPAGMLVEPFVQPLAAALKTEIDHAMQNFALRRT